MRGAVLEASLLVPRSQTTPTPMATPLLGVLLLVLPVLPVLPVPPAPRELARAVLEAHGQDAGSGLKLLKLQGVSRTVGPRSGNPPPL